MYPLPALAVIVVDQASKYLLAGGAPTNPGIAFGVGGSPLAVAAVLFLGCVAAWWLYRGSAKRPAERYAWSIVAGGVASNLLDRVRLGAVIDPLSIPILRISCNIADAAVVSGIVVLSVLAFRRSR